MAPDECDRARTEQSALESAGVTTDMAQGADWARANLGPDRLQRVARWLELQEQILFRCPRPKPPEAITAEPREDGDQPAQAQKPRKQKSAQKPKPPAETAQQEAGDGAVDAEPAKPKPQPQKKPKAVDAYRPPAPFSGDEIQHPIPGSSIPLAPATGLAP
jgi:hypothetical protein